MTSISPLELAALVDNDEPVDIIDLRSRAEFERAHIAGSHWLTTTDITPQAVLFERELLPTAPLYLISKNGAFARFIAAKLERGGSDNLIVVTGGFEAWDQASLPTTGEAPHYHASTNADTPGVGCANSAR